MIYYPVYLDLRNRPCVVIGTGAEAKRKVQGLLEVGARVTVVTGEPSPALEGLAAEERIALRRRPYQEGDLAGAFLAIAATTDDLELSERIAVEARNAGVLLNVMDITHLCTWIAPALVERGDLTVAISSAGKSPAFTRFVKEELEQLLPREYGPLLELLTAVRQELRRRRVRVRPDAWQEALASGAWRDLVQRDAGEAQDYLVTLLASRRQKRPPVEKTAP